MGHETDIKIGKFIARVLRHKPEDAGIILDSHGWADVKTLIDGVRATGRTIDMEILERIVATNNKQRFSFNENKTKIRANQGHSVLVDVDLQEVEPPEILYHGTATSFMDSIMKDGLKPMSRLYVHLSKDRKTAVSVGKRHGKPVVIPVNSGQMYRDDVKFYLSENGVWMTGYVAAKYLENPEY